MGSTEARPLSISPPDRSPELAKYELVGELGHGGMATVYQAHDKRLDREVAVKVIHRHLRENREVSARFVAEARAVAKLRHPNIVDVYDVSDEAETERYLVVEWVRGPTLRKLIEVYGHFPAEIAAAITIELCEALAHAHDQGVIHRDVKPENVLIDMSGLSKEDNPETLGPRVKITDFGIAKLLDAQGVTSTGQVLGSPAHMAPEQIEGGPVTARSDVFGLGVLLYESAVGKLPFDGRNPAQVLRRVLDGNYVPADRERPTVGASFSQIIDQSLAHDSEARFSSARDLAAALRAELGELGFADHRRAFEAFLQDPTAYLAAYPGTLIDRLVELGCQAQRQNQTQRAASCFNRALAFRPDDVGLLRQVTALARRERLRITLWRAAGVGAIGLGLAVSSYLALEFGKSLWSPPSAPSPEGPLGSVLPPARVTHRPAPPPTLAPSEAIPVPSSQHILRTGRSPAVPTPVRTPEKVLRPVQVMITSGALGGYILVDGHRLVHGETVELTVGGTYAFEFRPQDGDKDCCDATRKVVTIAANTTTVAGSVPFRKATVLASGAPAGSELKCGAYAAVTTPSVLSIDLSEQPSMVVSCSVIPPASSGFSTRQSQVNLRPGKSTNIWQ